MTLIVWFVGACLGGALLGGSMAWSIADARIQRATGEVQQLQNELQLLAEDRQSEAVDKRLAQKRVGELSHALDVEIVKRTAIEADMRVDKARRETIEAKLIETDRKLRAVVDICRRNFGPNAGTIREKVRVELGLKDWRQ